MNTMTTPDALKLVANLRDWAEDAEEHNSHFVPLTAKTLLMCSSTIEQQHAALESLRSEVQEQARLNGMGAERELALIARQNELMRQVESLRAGRAVPELMPVFDELDDEVIDAACTAGSIYRVDLMRAWECVRCMISAAPTPPQAEQEIEDWTQPHPPTRHCMCPSCIPSFDDRFKPWVEQAGKVARFDGDNNIESPFNACMHKGYCLSLKNSPAPQPDDARDAFAGVPWPPIEIELNLGPQQVILHYGTEAETFRAYAAMTTHDGKGGV